MQDGKIFYLNLSELRKGLKKHFASSEISCTFASVMKRYNNILCNATLCGETSIEEGVSSHITPKPHSCHTDTTDPSESSVRSFSKPQEVFVISRDIYNKAIADKKLLKALAFAISAKSLIRCSVAKHPTMKQLANLVGVSEYRAKRAIDTLLKYGYAEYDERGNLRFKRLKYKYNNIYLKGINTDSYQSAYMGLHAAAICDLIQKTEFVRQQFITKEKPLNRPTKAQKRRFNRAVRYCNQQGIHSLSDFSQNGYSYNLICKKYHFSKREVSAAVKYGVKNNMFSADNTLCVLYENENRNVAIAALETMQDLAEEKCVTTELSEKLQNLRNEFNKGFIQMYHNLGEKMKRAFVRYNEKKETYQVVFNSTNLYILNYKRHTLGGRSMCSDIIKVPILV